MIYQGARKAPVREAVVHCAATRPGWMDGRPTAEKVAEIRRWHTQDRGWRDIGYHWIIDRDGALARGRPENVIGAGVAGHNTGVIHVCLLGGHGASATDPFAANFTPAQDRALRQLLQEIARRTKVARITGHNDHAAKACPGFMVSEWLAAGA